MSQIVLNILVAVVALVAIFGFWIGAHLLARYRLGERRLGCRGPTVDETGSEICCHTGEVCERSAEGGDGCETLLE